MRSIKTIGLYTRMSVGLFIAVALLCLLVSGCPPKPQSVDPQLGSPQADRPEADTTEPGEELAKEAALEGHDGWVAKVVENSDDWTTAVVWTGPPESEWVWSVRLQWNPESGSYDSVEVTEVAEEAGYAEDDAAGDEGHDDTEDDDSGHKGHDDADDDSGHEGDDHAEE